MAREIARSIQCASASSKRRTGSPNCWRPRNGGEEVIIARRGEAVATLNPIRRTLSPAEADALMARVRARRETFDFTTTPEKIEADIDAGRRY
jgi:antitoxin (DNA-binding transcriptional repressor) of toxin-antitoxin stability system